MCRVNPYFKNNIFITHNQYLHLRIDDSIS